MKVSSIDNIEFGFDTCNNHNLSLLYLYVLEHISLNC